MKNFKLFLSEGKKWDGRTFPKKGDQVTLTYKIKLNDYETIATIVKVGKPPLVMKLKPERVSSWDDKKKFGWYNGKYKVDAKTFDGPLKLTLEYEHIGKGKIKEVFEQEVSNLTGKETFYRTDGRGLQPYDKKYEGGSWSYGKLATPDNANPSQGKKTMATKDDWDGKGKIKVGMFVDYESPKYSDPNHQPAKVIKISGKKVTIDTVYHSDRKSRGDGHQVVDKKYLGAMGYANY